MGLRTAAMAIPMLLFVGAALVVADPDPSPAMAPVCTEEIACMGLYCRNDDDCGVCRCNVETLECEPE